MMFSKLSRRSTRGTWLTRLFGEPLPNSISDDINLVLQFKMLLFLVVGKRVLDCGLRPLCFIRQCVGLRDAAVHDRGVDVREMPHQHLQVLDVAASEAV